MRILAIETSCDDTAISIVEVKGSLSKPVFKVLAHNVSSQIKIHQAWGGVVPALAKREHGKNLVPILIKSLAEAFGKIQKNEKSNLGLTRGSTSKNPITSKKLGKILEREAELKEQFLKIIPSLKIPKIDAIAATKGPGLEPALWVGINFAKALALVWDRPLYPVNHLEGHILSGLQIQNSNIKNQNDNAKEKNRKKNEQVKFPIISLIVSGGHTELVLSKNWLKYKIIGQTRDDAVGEAFDKVARILGLPYPGGPEISNLALKAIQLPRTVLKAPQGPSSVPIKLPRPMLHSGDFDFSFSGLKTAILYLVQKLKAENKFDGNVKAEIAYEFQQAAIEVLVAKTLAASKKFKAKTIIAGGGVIANTALRGVLELTAKTHKLKLLIPELAYSTDNATMIALAAGLRLLTGKNKISHTFKAEGNLNLK